jgi:hypothetical protein
MVKGSLNTKCYKLTAEFILLKKVVGAHGSVWIGRNDKGEEAYSQNATEVLNDLT